MTGDSSRGLKDGCTAAVIGYTPPIFNDVLSGQVFGGTEFVGHRLLGALVLSPITAGFSLVSLFFALFAWVCSSRIMEIVSACPSYRRRMTD